MLLGESLEDYLETIMILSEKGKVRSIDVAKLMEVSKPSVNKAVNNLKERGLITQETYGDIQLTQEGTKMAEAIFHRHKTIRSFLIDVLHVSVDTAEKDACRIEHIISEETFQNILSCLKNNKENNS